WAQQTGACACVFRGAHRCGGGAVRAGPLLAQLRREVPGFPGGHVQRRDRGGAAAVHPRAEGDLHPHHPEGGPAGHRPGRAGGRSRAGGAPPAQPNPVWPPGLLAGHQRSSARADLLHQRLHQGVCAAGPAGAAEEPQQVPHRPQLRLEVRRRGGPASPAPAPGPAPAPAPPLPRPRPLSLQVPEVPGSRHPTLVVPLVPELLNTHPYFDTPEPDMDDPAYMAVLVLVFNAARWCPTMPALFSDHTFRHYAYLRDSLSHLVPPLRVRLLRWPLPRAGPLTRPPPAAPLPLPPAARQRAGPGGLPRRLGLGGVAPALPAAEPEPGQHHPEPGGPWSPGAAGPHHTVGALALPGPPTGGPSEGHH
ncbi:unnamed protein product, partial [Tetraodon nigroviridis]